VELLLMYYDLFDHDTPTVMDTFCHFCGIHSINDLETRLEVIRGRWFWHQLKARIEIPISLNRNLSAISPPFKDMSFCMLKATFSVPTPIPAKISGAPLGADPWCWGLQRVNTPTN